MSQSPDRIDEVLLALEEVWRRHPELRLGQLLVNAIRPQTPAPEIYSCPDRTLLRRLEAYPKGEGE